ncbi:MAG TPA: hypothetical protein VFR27_15260 [Mycobacterium sp.]|nr:hypothetical protein [Mycobacterium sp.]
MRTWVIDNRAQGALRDKGNIARAADGGTGPTTFLIRPDGYVGAVTTTGDANTVLDMFRRLPATAPTANRGTDPVTPRSSRGDRRS